MTVGSAMLHSPSAAGGLALSIVPSGKHDFERTKAALVHRRDRARSGI